MLPLVPLSFETNITFMKTQRNEADALFPTLPGVIITATFERSQKKWVYQQIMHIQWPSRQKTKRVFTYIYVCVCQDIINVRDMWCIDVGGSLWAHKHITSVNKHIYWTRRPRAAEYGNPHILKNKENPQYISHTHTHANTGRFPYTHPFDVPIYYYTTTLAPCQSTTIRTQWSNDC